MLTLQPGPHLKILESEILISIKQFCRNQKIRAKAAKEGEHTEALSNLYFHNFLMQGANEIQNNQYDGFDTFKQDFERGLKLLIYGELIDYKSFCEWCDKRSLAQNNNKSLIEFLLTKKVSAKQIKLIQRYYCQTVTSPFTGMIKAGISNFQIHLDEQKSCFLIFDKKDAVNCETRTALTVTYPEPIQQIPGIISTRTRFTEKGPELRQTGSSNPLLEKFVLGRFPETIDELRNNIAAVSNLEREAVIAERYQRAFRNTEQLLTQLNPRLTEAPPDDALAIEIITESDIARAIFKADVRKFLDFIPRARQLPTAIGAKGAIKKIVTAYEAWVINPLSMQQLYQLKMNIRQFHLLLVAHEKFTTFSRYFKQADLLFKRIVSEIHQNEIIYAAIEETEKQYLPEISPIQDQPKSLVDTDELESDSKKLIKIERLKLACERSHNGADNLQLIELKTLLNSNMTPTEKSQQFTENSLGFSAEYLEIFKNSEEAWEDVVSKNFLESYNNDLSKWDLCLLLPTYVQFFQTYHQVLVDDPSMGNHAGIQKFLLPIFGNPLKLGLVVEQNQRKLETALEEHKNNIAAIKNLKSKLASYTLIGNDLVTNDKREAVETLTQTLDDKTMTSKERLANFKTELDNQEKMLRKIRDPQGNCLFTAFQPIAHAGKFLLNKIGLFTVRGQRVTQELNEILSKSITP